MKTTKKKFFLMILFAGLVSVVVCMMAVSSILRTDQIISDEETKVVILKEHTVIPSRSSSKKENDAANKYYFEEKIYSHEKIKIKYPQIHDLADEQFQKEVNQMISEFVLQKAGELSFKTEYSLEYQVTEQTNEMISILWKGIMNSPEAMYPNGILYTLTLDLNENKILSLRDLEDLDEVTDSLIECADLPMYDMNGERISKDWQSEIEAYLSEYKHKKLLEELKQFDLSVDKEYEPAGYSYFENGKLHICISVPHALGDYIDIVPDRVKNIVIKNS